MFLTLRGFTSDLVPDIDEILQRFLPFSKLVEKVPVNPAVPYDSCSVFEPADTKYRIRQIFVLFFPEQQECRVGQLIPGYEPEPRKDRDSRFALIRNGKPPELFA
jgi:hypothetical protein